MKKTLIVIITILTVIIIVTSIAVIENSKTIKNIKKENKEFELVLDKEIWGTDVVTLMNKAIDTNEKNQIVKDEKGFYIENTTNSIKIELNMINGENIQTVQMETIQKVGTIGFIQNFNLIKFKCSKIEYHDTTKRIKKLVFEQLEE
ncbi:MAG: hypothetical protein HFJ53_06405 [Clostridia bacterium]|jgi:hypothetical protein|nr:hypothetical protein [Clostridia bacterium]